mmetsp:Transcript_6271/g.21540  ORF Transcript_6271/g.21540 Transcript_6271/m.21540 type:complete len:629 (-) Transcript_6271:182-2068(-)
MILARGPLLVVHLCALVEGLEHGLGVKEVRHPLGLLARLAPALDATREAGGGLVGVVHALRAVDDEAVGDGLGLHSDIVHRDGLGEVHGALPALAVVEREEEVVGGAVAGQPGEHDDAPVVADLEDVRALLHLVPRAAAVPAEVGVGAGGVEGEVPPHVAHAHDDPRGRVLGVHACNGGLSGAAVGRGPRDRPVEVQAAGAVARVLGTGRVVQGRGDVVPPRPAVEGDLGGDVVRVGSLGAEAGVVKAGDVDLVGDEGPGEAVHAVEVHEGPHLEVVLEAEGEEGLVLPARVDVADGRHRLDHVLLVVVHADQHGAVHKVHQRVPAVVEGHGEADLVEGLAVVAAHVQAHAGAPGVPGVGALLLARGAVVGDGEVHIVPHDLELVAAVDELLVLVPEERGGAHKGHAAVPPHKGRPCAGRHLVHRREDGLLGLLGSPGFVPPLVVHKAVDAPPGTFREVLELRAVVVGVQEVHGAHRVGEAVVAEARRAPHEDQDHVGLRGVRLDVDDPGIRDVDGAEGAPGILGVPVPRARPLHEYIHVLRAGTGVVVQGHHSQLLLRGGELGGDEVAQRARLVLPEGRVPAVVVPPELPPVRDLGVLGDRKHREVVLPEPEELLDFPGKCNLGEGR